MKTYYDVLGVPEDADESAIRNAYRQAIRKNHPDLNSADPHASRKSRRLNVAYQVLKDPEARRKYDEKLKRTRERQSSPSTMKSASNDVSSYDSGCSGESRQGEINTSASVEPGDDFENQKDTGAHPLRSSRSRHLSTPSISLLITITVFVLLFVVLWAFREYGWTPDEVAAPKLSAKSELSQSPFGARHANRSLESPEDGEPDDEDAVDMSSVEQPVEESAPSTWDEGDGSSVLTKELGEGLILRIDCEVVSLGADGNPRVKDLSPLKQECVLYGASVTPDGKIGSGLRFDGLDDYVLMPSLRGTLARDVPAFSIACWVAPQARGKLNFVFDVGLHAPKGISLIVTPAAATADTFVNFHMPHDSGGTGVDAYLPLDKEWFHVAATWSGAEMRLYVDGQLRAVKQTRPFRLNSSSLSSEQARLGSQAKGKRQARFFGGRLDEVLIYQRALDQAEVEAIYALGTTSPSNK